MRPMKPWFGSLAWCGLLLLLGGPTAWGQERPDLFVLSVGIDKYQAPTPSLKGCVNDALGMVKVFQGQEGKQFERVEALVLADEKASQAAIRTGLKTLETRGKAGDWYVLVLSGHGGINHHEWGFLAHDNIDVSEFTILLLADKLAGAGKKVVIIIDACHAGQLRFAASGLLNRYRDPDKGGILLMVSSMPDQTSAALGDFSAFARAAEEGLSGMADFDTDDFVTLKELRRFTYNRVIDLCLSRRLFPGTTVSYQDSAIDASLSFPETTPLVRSKRPAPSPAIEDGPDVPSRHLADRSWKISIPGTGTAAPLHYELKLDHFGLYRATLMEGTRPVKITNGAYRIKERAVQLLHHQGMDRLEVVSVSPSAFHFRFGGRDFKARTDALASGVLLVDATGRLLPEDPPDRIRKESPHKVHLAKLEAGVSCVINLQSPDFDTVLRVEDDAGTHLAEDDDGGEGRNSRLVFTPPRAGAYRLIVTAFRGGAGVYHLNVEKNSGARPPDRPSVGETLLNVTHQLLETDAKDRARALSFCREYKIELKAGLPCTLDMVSNDFDTFLRLEEEDGRTIASDDDSGGNLNARLMFTPTRTATYRIIATSYQTATGRFTLTVRAAGATAPVGKGEIPHALKAGRAVAVDRLTEKDGLDTMRRGSFRKVYLVRLEAGMGYSMTLKSTQFDAYLRVENAAGRELAHDDDGGGETDARLTFRPTAGATYRIIVTSFHERSTGAFTLSILESAP